MVNDAAAAAATAAFKQHTITILYIVMYMMKGSLHLLYCMFLMFLCITMVNKQNKTKKNHTFY